MMRKIVIAGLFLLLPTTIIRANDLPESMLYRGFVKCAVNQLCSGWVKDAGGCRHKVTLDQAVEPWLFDFPSRDSCHDPANVPDQIIQMYSDGTFVAEFTCWVEAAQGQWTMQKGARGWWRIVLTGMRSEVIYFPGCGN
jgi:hypothetical protein